jgi:ribosomal protein L12E/L44/L45/RPP1/RPP2
MTGGEISDCPAWGRKGEAMKATLRRTTALLVALMLVLAACGSDSGDETPAASDDATEEAEESPTPEDTGPAVYVAQEFSFDGPDTLPAGETTLGLKNGGKQPHQLLLVELLKGKTLDDVMAELEKNADAPPPPWVRVIRKQAFAKPDKSDEITVELTAGSYVMLCFIPDKESKKPHAVLGMVKPVTVE